VRIIVISDSHGNGRNLGKIIENNLNADIFMHLGDGEREYLEITKRYENIDFRFVRGNNDYASTAPIFQIIDTDKARIFCTHGNRYGVYGGLNSLFLTAKANDCNVALFGHTHIALEDYEDGVYFLNPGSCSQPRGGKGPSYGFVDITNAGIVTGIVYI
jgi:putative phosphoesterase